ncbi:hypothetical protein CORC01_11864 [Colletotrichum orchidophilum]|uniref:Uncharacterized protein n=1 Tax=Colletotrichum orchidophilum TaxID=1209926 RepID=A0A1G4AUM4_9PEZI|nr:uncharacterized protein CORC01_11864 [Colletotrichum orchidophilum]OHE92858.1 hypothetical protein CORC01_11864 [Colletotrichum orchidophilum]
MKTTSSWALTLCASFALCEARSLWSSIPTTYGDSSSDTYLLKTGYPIGNGKLGAIPFGPPHAEKVNLNIDSLWAGGPFEASNYTGGNPTEPKYGALPKIRSTTFENGTGDVSPILGSGANYGGNRVLANMTVTIDGVGNYTSYKRTLDLTTGVHSTKFTANAANYEITQLCSYPDQVCVYHIASSSSSSASIHVATLPAVTIGFENQLIATDTFNTSCGGDHVRFTGVTQLGPPEGMKFDSIAKLSRDSASAAAATNCTTSGMMQITPGTGQKTLTIVISAETNYDQKKGNAANSYSFKGQDPGPTVQTLSSAASSKPYSDILSSHIADYQRLQSAFQLTLPDPLSSAERETADLIQEYLYTSPGDPYLEAILFDYARHLLIASSRENSLPANLQGRWTEQLSPAWSADYHANINLQMNYWHADQTGLAETQVALWNYMEDTWVPRGTETAALIYNASGWVVHNEMNIFGHTALKEGAEWANYPAAAAWMMQEVYDAFEYTQDTTWFARQGYPLIKGVAAFWLTQLQDDTFSSDGALVVNPCNSPETGPTTFGCAHYHQVIHQVFDYTLRGATFLPDPPSPESQQFLDAVAASLAKLDKGVHIASWGGLKEWKLPEEPPYNADKPSTHRHLSHLTGWYPGASLSAFLAGYTTNLPLQSAVRETLLSRGMGNAPDANAGWAKVWRAACWARLNDTERAYAQLRYAISVNFAGNGLSMYSATDPPFQIDANFGLAGAVLSMLVVDLPLPYASPSVGDEEDVRTVVLGPAIPARWGSGSVKGLRIRGGGVVDFGWDEQGVVNEAVVRSRSRAAGGRKVRIVNIQGRILAQI